MDHMNHIGTVFYMAWGGLHLVAAYRLKQMGSEMEPGIVKGRLLQSAWNLMCAAIVVLAVAAAFNWQNSALGYWLNLTVASLTDIGFIIFILVPAYVPLWPGSLGPVLWILAALFSTLGILGIAA
jgi:hypothetical protein